MGKKEIVESTEYATYKTVFFCSNSQQLAAVISESSISKMAGLSAVYDAP